ncbi:MAG: hypothetical protein GY861_20035 [bacterium]|nr:hypothetical protein [bacterium]
MNVPTLTDLNDMSNMSMESLAVFPGVKGEDGKFLPKQPPLFIWKGLRGDDGRTQFLAIKATEVYLGEEEKKDES